MLDLQVRYKIQYTIYRRFLKARGVLQSEITSFQLSPWKKTAALSDKIVHLDQNAHFNTPKSNNFL